MQSKILIMALFTTISACGGGGGGGGGSGGSGGGPATQNVLSFNPGIIKGEDFQGTSQTYIVSASLNREVAGQINVAIIDRVGVINPNLTLTPATQLSYKATISTQANLPVGNYKGNLEVQLCSDVPTTCALPIPGSPWLLPYDFTVKSNIGNLSPLIPFPAANDWGMHQGNASHNGYVPVTLDPAKFNFRWRWTTPTDIPVHPVVASNGTVYVATANLPPQTSPITVDSKPNMLFAIREADRTVVWQYGFASGVADPATVATYANPPAVANGKVFLATNVHGRDIASMWSFDGTTGAVQSKQIINSVFEHYYAPTIIDGAVFSNGGSNVGATNGPNIGMLSFKQFDGSTNWFTQLPRYDQWTPAIDSTRAYACFAEGLYVFDKTTGAFLFNIPGNFGVGGNSVYGAPMLGSNNNVLGMSHRGFSNSSEIFRLSNFDIPAKNVKWTVSGRITLDPALAKGVIYLANGQQIEARSETDGALLWTWIPPETNDPFSFSSGDVSGISDVPRNIIVTDNLLFVSTKTTVYAISLTTHQPVWSYPASGKLALSASGLLYISVNKTNLGMLGNQPFIGGPDKGAVIAFNLQ